MSAEPPEAASYAVGMSAASRTESPRVLVAEDDSRLAGML